MAVNPYTEARAKANSEYDARTFKKHMFRFRLDADQDILASIEEAKEHGISKNQWLRDLYDNGGLSPKRVEAAMRDNGVPENLISKVISAL